MSALAPWLGPLISGAVSIYVAWNIFCWQGRKDRERWVIDQEKAEWKELLTAVAAIEEIIPMVVTGLPAYEDLERRVLAVLPHLRSRVFVYRAIESSGFIGNWERFATYVSGGFDFTVKSDNLVQRGRLSEEVDLGARQRSAEERARVEGEVRIKLYNLREELRLLAHKELRKFDLRKLRI
jgi:hypothetical protein